MGKFLILIVISGITGWWATRRLRMRLEERLGRKVKGEHELTSISAWMEAESNSSRMEAESKETDGMLVYRTQLDNSVDSEKRV